MIERDELSILAAAAERPEALAIITHDRQLSFAEVAAQVVAAPPPTAAPGLQDAVPGHAAALLADRTVATVIAIYAALQRREPLGLLHPQQAERVRAQGERALRQHPVPPGTAVVLFTSGSTGAPRGVVLSRHALLAAARAHAGRLPWRGDDRWLVALPLAHAGGLAAVIRCLVARRPIALVETEGPDARPRWPLAEALAQSGATLTSLVPTQLASLLAYPSWRPPPSLRAVLVGGAACPPSLRRRALERAVPVLVSYGMTETFGQVATALPDETEPRAEPEAEPSAAPGADAEPAATDDRIDTAIGPALPGLTLVAGTEHAPATIEIRGPVCMTGYLGEPPLPSPRVVTSDEGWLDARGHLHVVGRRDDLIISGGYKIAPLALEEELRRTPGVLEACAFAIADERWGQLVGAALVVAEGYQLEAASAAWAQTLPPHQRPRVIVIVDRLPLSANGKVDRAAVALLQPRLAVPRRKG